MNRLPILCAYFPSMPGQSTASMYQRIVTSWPRLLRTVSCYFYTQAWGIMEYMDLVCTSIRNDVKISLNLILIREMYQSRQRETGNIMTLGLLYEHF